MSKPLKLREFIGVSDAARYLSILYYEEVSEADIFRLVLDGNLELHRMVELGATTSQVRPELEEGIPSGSDLVVRIAALRELERRISNPQKPEEKPLRKRERTTLLIISLPSPI